MQSSDGLEGGKVNDNEVHEILDAELEGGQAPMEEDSDDGGEGGEDGEDNGDDQFQDSSIAAFYDHRNSVFSLQLHPKYPQIPIAFSGGADDKGRLWDTRTGANIVELTGHEDSVVSGGFSATGSFVATGGLDGRIRIWKLHAPASGTFAPVEMGAAPTTEWGHCEFITTLEGPDEIVWLDWHPKGDNVLAAGASDSTVWMWHIPSGKVMNVFSGHTAAVSCGQFSPDGRRLITASDDGSLIVWDPKDANALSKLQPGDARFNMQTGITALAVSFDGKIAVVGGAAGAIRVVNLSNIEDGGAALVVAALTGHNDGDSIERISFIDLLGNPNGQATQPAPKATTSTNVVSVSTDGKAIIWDLSAGKVRCEAHLEEAITDLVVHGSGPLFTTSTSEGKVVTFDARNANHVAVHHGFTDAVLNVVAGPDDGYTQGAETGGVGAYANLEASKGWKVVAAGDEGVALVFRA